MAITSTSEPPVSAIDHNYNKSKAMAWLETEVVDYDMLIGGGIAGLQPSHRSLRSIKFKFCKLSIRSSKGNWFASIFRTKP